MVAKSTVVVGCKLPHGLHLDLNGKRVTLAGLNSTEIIGGHGITHGVDKDFFDNWMVLNASHPAVKNEFIFAHEQAASVAAKANDHKKELTGFEGIDPNKPGKNIERADVKAKD